MSTDNFRPGTPLLDYLRGRAEALDRQRGRGAATRSKGGPPGGAGHANRSPLALVDGLVVRVLARPGRPRREIVLIQERFRAAFVGVWHRLPAADRLRLLRYWADRSDPGLRGSSSPSPLIRVLDGASSALPPACDRLGHRLTFDAAAAVEQPDRLPLRIAHTLAQVYLLATRRHWALAVDLIEGPLGRWERRLGKKADDAARERKLDLLEAAHRRAYEAELQQRLRA
jgi:hypothetical protein